MLRFTLKILITALVVAGVSELAKRHSWMAAILAALPLTSILAMCWLYWDTGDTARVAELSRGILWAVLPSLLFFWILPLLLKQGLRFPAALAISSAVMTGAYAIYAWAAARLGVTGL